MYKIAVVATIGLALAGCANSTRTVYVPTIEERTLSGDVVIERAPLVVPPNHHSYVLPPPREDPVLKEWQRNNFVGSTHTVDRSATLTKPKDLRQPPLPPRRPCSAGNTPGCDRGR